ncbi:Phosphate acetyltransferase [Candidatus Izimaplasma bacterium HR1]|jgi:phosphate butyryltransferase|uniref:phosphate butyryltransferase n=1 Tax=Candidatus Izimoplasma sp. HR1 TaxID=1541959 RepID=UPI0004F6991D|nr:Phosphate acetyltransferase [Candidatus Izimaplasma bacterium HR1]
MIKTINDLVLKAKEIETKTLVVACAADEHVLEAVEMARQEDIVNPILIGNKTEILGIFKQHNINESNYEIIDERDKPTACLEAVKLVSANNGYYLMKGLVDTSVILKAALNKEFGLRTSNRISHVSVMEVPTHDKLLYMTDGAMNIAPNLDEKRQIIENSVKIAHAVGNKLPNVGIICAVEKVNPQMEATLHAADLVKMNEDGIIKDCIVGGPFAIDNAISVEAAKHKGITNPIAGNIDILVMPRIEAGNVFYKTMMFLASAKSASVIAGAKKPIVLTSRADSKESKFYSIALGALVTNL